jgi:hypothetical protein
MMANANEDSLSEGYESDTDSSSSSDEDTELTLEQLLKVIKGLTIEMREKDKKINILTSDLESAIAHGCEVENKLKDSNASFIALQSCYKEFHNDHEELSNKHKILEFAFETSTKHCTPSSSSAPKETSSTTHNPKSSLDASILKEYHQLKEERNMVMDGFERLTRGRAIHKEILGKNLFNNVKQKGLGSSPSIINNIGQDEEIPKWAKSLMADDYYCERCCKDGHTMKDCPMKKEKMVLPKANTYNLFHENTHYKLFQNKDGKIMAKPLGPPDKTRKVKSIWVPKVLVDLERKTNLRWAPKNKKS